LHVDDLGANPIDALLVGCSAREQGAGSPLELAHGGHGSGDLAVDGVAAKSICASTPSASAITPMVSSDTLLRACSIEPMWDR
jgi:hypothetical protein